MLALVCLPPQIVKMSTPLFWFHCLPQHQTVAQKGNNITITIQTYAEIPSLWKQLFWKAQFEMTKNNIFSANACRMFAWRSQPVMNFWNHFKPCSRLDQTLSYISSTKILPPICGCPWTPDGLHCLTATNTQDPREKRLASTQSKPSGIFDLPKTQKKSTDGLASSSTHPHKFTRFDFILLTLFAGRISFRLLFSPVFRFPTGLMSSTSIPDNWLAPGNNPVVQATLPPTQISTPFY